MKNQATDSHHHVHTGLVVVGGTHASIGVNADGLLSMNCTYNGQSPLYIGLGVLYLYGRREKAECSYDATWLSSNADILTIKAGQSSVYFQLTCGCDSTQTIMFITHTEYDCSKHTYIYISVYTSKLLYV